MTGGGVDASVLRQTLRDAGKRALGVSKMTHK